MSAFSTPFGGGTGTAAGSGIIIDDDHWFADTTARDAAFDGSQPVNTYIAVDGGLGDYEYQRWDGSAWIDVTAIVTGPKGDPGDDHTHTNKNTLDKITEAAGDPLWEGNPWPGGGGGTYTGDAERTVGGITDGDSFVGKTMTEMWDQLIKQEKNPTLTAPSSTFTSTVTGFREVGEDIASITFASAFNRGSINPQYTAATPYRSGDPNEYEFTGTGLTNQVKTALTDSQTITNYTVLVNAQNWQGRVQYDAGPQPQTSYDNDYDSPLAAGNTSYITRTITGVYPVFATTADITTMTKQALGSMTATYFQVDVVAETSDKQTVDVPDAWAAITGIQFYNTVSSAWEWIGGSKVNSLATFDVTATTQTIQGNVINYDRYTHNGSQIGARQLRFYTT